MCQKSGCTPKFYRMIHSAYSSTFIQDEFQSQFFQAAKDRDRESLQEWLDQGVHINVQEPSSGNTVLHHLLGYGCFCENCTVKLEKCLEMLLHKGADPNVQNFSQKVPIEFAVDSLVPFGLVKLMMEHGATITSKSGISNRGLMKKLIRKMPEAIYETLDKGVNLKGSANDAVNTTVQLDWGYIVYAEEGFEDYGHGKWKETEFLHDVVEKGTSEGKRIILTHPLVRAFLHLKSPNYWRPFGLFYCLWIIWTLFMYVMFISKLYSDTCRYGRNSTSIDNVALTNADGAPWLTEQECHIGTFEAVIAYIILVFYLIGPVGLELRKLLTMGLICWLKQWQQLIFLPTSVLVGVTLYPALISPNADYTFTWQYPIAAIGMLIGSLTIMVQMTPIPFVALYLEMLLKVLSRIVVAAIAVSPLLIGFFFSFRILLTSETIGWFQLFTMIVSGGDYEELMDENRGEFYQIVAYLFFSAFILLVIIVVLNLLIGLAVSDVDQLKEYAQITNQINKVKSYYLADGVYGRGSKRLLTSAGLDYQFQPLQENTSTPLPAPLKIELLQLARSSSCPTATTRLKTATKTDLPAQSK